MKLFSAVVVSVLLSAACYGLCGCTQVAAGVVPPSTQTSSPAGLAGMDEPAVLHAALPVLHAYISAAVSVGADPAIDASVLSPFANDTVVEAVRKTQRGLVDRGERMQGEVTVATAEVQDQDPSAGTFTLLVCEQLDKLRIVNERGEDVTPDSRDTTATMQISFVGWPDDIRVDRSVVWSGASVC